MGAAPSSALCEPPAPLLGVGRGSEQVAPLTIVKALPHWVRLDNTGKTYPVRLEPGRCGSPILPEGGLGGKYTYSIRLGVYGEI